MSVSREDLERFLEGHRTAHVRLREETLKRLPSLTVEEARAQYDSLCRVWEASRDLDNRRVLDRRAIRDRVAVRHRLAGQR